MLHDFALALRAMRQNPVVSLVSLTTLGLGLGATTAIFSVVDGVLLQPMPIADPDRIIVLRESWLPPRAGTPATRRHRSRGMSLRLSRYAARECRIACYGRACQPTS